MLSICFANWFWVTMHNVCSVLDLWHTQLNLVCYIYFLTTTWILFVFYDKKKNVDGEASVHMYSTKSLIRTNKNVCIIQLIIYSVMDHRWQTLFQEKNLLFHAFYRCYLGMEFLMVQKFMRLQRKSSAMY